MGTRRVYHEDFLSGPGGWASWGTWPEDADEPPPPSGNPGAGSLELELTGGGGFISRSPWWVDYNHAPPGQPAYPGVFVKGSYLHLLAGLVTAPQPAGATFGDAAAKDPNHFITEGFPSDFTDAVVTVRVKGQLEARGARLGLLAQARNEKQSSASQALNVNSVMAFPDAITPAWREQSITLRPDDALWQCLGSRVDRLAGHPENSNPAIAYGSGPARELLASLTGNIIIVLFDLLVQVLHLLIPRTARHIKRVIREARQHHPRALRPGRASERHAMKLAHGPAPASLLQPFIVASPLRSARANLHLLGQPNAFLAAACRRRARAGRRGAHPAGGARLQG